MVFHLDILGNDINPEHWLNILFKTVTLLKFQLDKSGKDFKEEHP